MFSTLSMFYCIYFFVLAGGELKDIETGGPFKFAVEDNHSYNQARYEALGEVKAINHLRHFGIVYGCFKRKIYIYITCLKLYVHSYTLSNEFMLQAITEEVYRLLETEGSLKKMQIPVSTATVAITVVLFL